MNRLLLPLPLLLALGCGTQTPPQPPPSTVQAQPASRFGHVAPIQLPDGEYFHAFHVIQAVWDGAQCGGSQKAPERYFFSTAPNPHRGPSGGTFTLRDANGVPVLVVRDPR